MTAIVSGVFAVIVAGVSGISAYLLGKRNLNQRLAELKESGSQDRATAEREYQLQAMKTFREAVGGPKSQIIEAVHDLSDRLRRFLSREQPWEWTDSRSTGYYRPSFTWLVVRPFVWIEILRRRMVYLDQMLGDLVEEELRFFGYCRLLERALTEAGLFRGTTYDANVSSAHVFAGTLRATAEELIVRDGSNFTCMNAVEFDRDEDGRGRSCAAAIEEVLSDLHRDSAKDYRVARLIALYCATNSLLQGFHLPFREHETVSESLRYVELVPDQIQDAIRSNLQRMLNEYSPTPAS